MGQQDVSIQANWNLLAYLNSVCGVISSLTDFFRVFSDDPHIQSRLWELDEFDKMCAHWGSYIFFQETDLKEATDSLHLFFLTVDVAVSERLLLLEHVLTKLHENSETKSAMQAVQRNIAFILNGVFAVHQHYAVFFPDSARKPLNVLLETLDNLKYESSGVNGAELLFSKLDQLTRYAYQCEFLSDFSSLYYPLLQLLKQSYKYSAYEKCVWLFDQLMMDCLPIKSSLSLFEENVYLKILGKRVMPEINKIVFNALMSQRSACQAVINLIKERDMLDDSLRRRLEDKKTVIGLVNIEPPKIRTSVLEACNVLKNLTGDTPISYVSGSSGLPFRVLLICHKQTSELGSLHELVAVILCDNEKSIFQLMTINAELDKRDNDKLIALLRANHGSNPKLSPIIELKTSAQVSVEDWTRCIAELADEEALSSQGVRALVMGFNASGLDARLQEGKHQYALLDSRRAALLSICQDQEKAQEQMGERIDNLEGQLRSMQLKLSAANEEKAALEQALAQKIQALEQLEAKEALSQEEINTQREIVSGLEAQIVEISSEGESAVAAEADAVKRMNLVVEKYTLLQQQLEDKNEVSEKNRKLERELQARDNLNRTLMDKLDEAQAQHSSRSHLASMRQPGRTLADELADAEGTSGQYALVKGGEQVDQERTTHQTDLGSLPRDSYRQAVAVGVPVDNSHMSVQCEQTVLAQPSPKQKVYQLKIMANFLGGMYDFHKAVFDEKINPAMEARRQIIAAERVSRINAAYQGRNVLDRVFNKKPEIDCADLDKQSQALEGDYHKAVNEIQQLSTDITDCLQPFVELTQKYYSNNKLDEGEYQRIAKFVTALIDGQLKTIDRQFLEELAGFKVSAIYLRAQALQQLSLSFSSKHQAFPILRFDEMLSSHEQTEAPEEKDTLFNTAKELSSMLAKADLLQALSAVQPHGDWGKPIRHLQRAMHSLIFVYNWQCDNGQSQLQEAVQASWRSISASSPLTQRELGTGADQVAQDMMGKTRSGSMRPDAELQFVLDHSSMMYQYQVLLQQSFVVLAKYANVSLEEGELTMSQTSLNNFILSYKQFLLGLYQMTVDEHSSHAKGDYALKNASERQLALLNRVSSKAGEVLDNLQPGIRAELEGKPSFFATAAGILEAHAKDMLPSRQLPGLETPRV